MKTATIYYTYPSDTAGQEDIHVHLHDSQLEALQWVDKNNPKNVVQTESGKATASKFCEGRTRAAYYRGVELTTTVKETI